MSSDISRELGPQPEGDDTLSEFILKMTPDERRGLRINAPCSCDPYGSLIAVTLAVKDEGHRYLIENAVNGR